MSKTPIYFPFHTKKRLILRAFIIFSFIGLFFIISPIVILSTAGYSYDFATHQITQTGVISVNAKPSDATVYLNGVRLNQHMPLRLSSLKPGTYHLRIEKDGYRSWEKDVSVSSKQTTYIKELTLSMDALPIFVTSTDHFSSFLFSPQGDYSLLSEANEYFFDVSVFHHATQERSLVQRLATTRSPVLSWSPYLPYFFVETTRDTAYIVSIVDARVPDEAHTYTVTSSLLHDSLWADDGSDYHMYTRDEDIIYGLHKDGRLDALYQTTSTLWYIDADDALWTYSASSSMLTAPSTFLNQEPPYVLNQPVDRIVSVNKKRVVLTTTDGRMIVVSRDRDWEDTITVFAADAFRFSGDDIIAWSDHELWTVYADGAATLLNRTSETLLSVFAADAYGALMYTTPEKLVSFNPGYYVSDDLFTRGSIETFTIDPILRRIYFIGRVAQRHGLFAQPY